MLWLVLDNWYWFMQNSIRLGCIIRVLFKVRVLSEQLLYMHAYLFIVSQLRQGAEWFLWKLFKKQFLFSAQCLLEHLTVHVLTGMMIIRIMVSHGYWQYDVGATLTSCKHCTSQFSSSYVEFTLQYMYYKYVRNLITPQTRPQTITNSVLSHVSAQSVIFIIWVPFSGPRWSNKALESAHATKIFHRFCQVHTYYVHWFVRLRKRPNVAECCVCREPNKGSVGYESIEWPRWQQERLWFQ